MPMSDVFVEIRNAYERKEYRSPPHQSHHKVLARNDECFTTDLPERWRLNYNRRMGHKKTGYFSKNNVPYVTFDNLKYTDVYDLIGENLDIVMQEQWHYNMQMYLAQRTRQDYSGEETDNSTANTIVVLCDGGRKSLPPSKTAGLGSLRTTLGSNTRTLVDMAAGNSFKETNRLDERRSKYLQEMRVPKEVKRNGRTVFVGNPSRYLRPLVQTASSKACLVSDLIDATGQDTRTTNLEGDQKKENGNRHSMAHQMYLTMAATEYSEDRDEFELARIKRKAQRECLARMHSVYAILCFLHNVKSKEMKSREPLSFSTVRGLSKKLFQSITNDSEMQRHYPPPSIASHSTHQLYQLYQLHHNNQGKSRNNRRDTVVETWEDLLHANQSTDKAKPHFSPLEISFAVQTEKPTSPISNYAAKGDACWPRGTTTETARASTCTSSKRQKVIPPWQRQVVYIKSSEEKIERDPIKKLSERMEAFQYFKSQMSQKLKNSLKERKVRREKHMAVRLAHLKLGPNRNQCLEHMRGKIYRLRREERVEEANRPLWYALLEKEVCTVYDQKGGDAWTLLLKLKQFIMVDNDAIPQVLEKLCLLVMSLPANHLSLAPVVTAIQFVTEHILKTPPTICQQWWDLRKLPPVTTELPDPAFLFGQQI